MRDAGRPADLWGWYSVPIQKLLHEKTLTDAIIALMPDAVWRGPEANRHPFPDAIVKWGELLFHVEMDMGTETHKQLRRRIAKHKKAGEKVLWIALSGTRIEAIRSLSEPTKNTAYFTTLEKCAERWARFDGAGGTPSEWRSKLCD